MIGILLINLGTPAAPTVPAVRAYLSEFLSDKRVIELATWLWKPILHGLILTFRVTRSAARYRAIWTEKGSPLLVNSQKLVEKLQDHLGADYKVVLAMRYGQPSLQQGLTLLQTQALKQLIILPLYPQYATSTIATSFDATAAILKAWRYIPSLHFVSGYYANPHYITAIAQSIHHHWAQLANRSYLLFSFHGLPKRSVRLGDPYWQQCHTSVRLVAEQLSLPANSYRMVFQSRFGCNRWLQPDCNGILSGLPKQGIKQVSVICPGFAVDCLETLEEIGQQGRRLFLAAGGEEFHYIPALNEASDQLILLKALVQSTV